MSRIDHANAGAPVLLAFDTSSRQTSLALSAGGEIIASFGAQLDDNRSARLWGVIDFLLTEVGFSIDGITLFAVCVGPGGFTGLRVGVTAAKGLAAATRSPLVGVTSLEAAAAAAREAAAAAAVDVVYVVNNAYKGEVYSQLFSFDGDGLPVAENAPLVSTAAAALERVGSHPRLVITGDAALANQEWVQKDVGLTSQACPSTPPRVCWSVREGEQFLATHIARIAYFRYKAGMTVAPEALRACYVRGADIKVKQQV